MDMLNKMTLQGRLTKDAELRQTQGGTKVSSFTVAWSEKYKETERQLFMPCVAWGKLAEFICLQFSKGSELIVEGFLTSRKWQDGQGNNRESIELTVDRLHFCGKKQTASEMPTVNETPTETIEVAGFEGFTAYADDGDLSF
jgi:single-strand DNA-binding protein